MDTEYAGQVGYYDGRALGYEEHASLFDDGGPLRHAYRQGYEAGVGDYCREEIGEDE